MHDAHTNREPPRQSMSAQMDIGEMGVAPSHELMLRCRAIVVGVHRPSSTEKEIIEIRPHTKHHEDNELADEAAGSHGGGLLGKEVVWGGCELSTESRYNIMRSMAQMIRLSRHVSRLHGQVTHGMREK